MQRRSKPLNEDFSNTEGLGKDGKSLALSPQAQSAHAKKPRLKRERRRYRLNKHTQTVYSILQEHNPENLVLNEETNQYYEDCESTEDTISNPSYKAPKSAKKEGIIDSGGLFAHFTVKYVDDKPGSFYHIFPDSEEFQVTRHGLIWLEPPVFEHEGISVRDSIEPPKEDLDLSGIGPRLWGFLNPLRPYVDLGVDIAELRDLPRLVKGRLDSIKSLVSSLSNPKGIADWFLGIQFGWKPLLSDIKKCINAFFKIEKRIEFLMRNGGEPLYRRTPPWKPVVTEEVLIDISSAEDQFWMLDEIPPDGDPDSMGDRFKCKLVLRKTVTEAASGVMTYHLGDIPPTPAYLRLRLFGLIADEALMWEATRWSWLIDWFSNTGDIIRNVEATARDRLVSLYAYSQRRIVREYKFTCSNGFYDCSVTRVYDTKCRAKIDPFGLAANVSLTDIQLGILVALGITRS